MHRRPIGELPLDHGRFRGVFEGMTEEGHAFRLEVRNGRRRMNSAEMVRSHIQAQVRGRLVPSVYKDTVEITLYVPDRHRTDIEIMPSGMYRHGRHAERTLRGLVTVLMEEMRPRPFPPGP